MNKLVQGHQAVKRHQIGDKYQAVCPLKIRLHPTYIISVQKKKCFNLWQVIENNINLETVEEIQPSKRLYFLSHPFTFDIANKHFTTKITLKHKIMK